MESTKTVIVLAGGDPAPNSVVESLPSFDYVIAADSGLDQADRLGIPVDLVVGDMDSADPELVMAAEAAGVAIDRHPEDKDATDLELALQAAVHRGATDIVVVGGASFDRIDHYLANALLVAGPITAGIPVTWLVKEAQILVVAGSRGFDADPGDLVTILPIGGSASGVSTSGLQWELNGDRLEVGSTRGVSNVVVIGPVKIAVDDGTVMAIHRGAT